MQLPEIGKVTASSFAPLCYVFFVRLFLQSRTPALLFPLHRTKYLRPFPISGAKVQQLPDICKCFGEKIAKICCKT